LDEAPTSLISEAPITPQGADTAPGSRATEGHGSQTTRAAYSENLCVYESFDALPPSYETLFRSAAKRSFFFSRAWFENLAKTTLGPDEQLCIFGLETADDAAGPLACLIMRTPAGQKGSIFTGKAFGPHSLAGLTTHPTTLFSPLVAESVTDPKAVLSRLLNKILSRIPSCTVFDLNRMDPEDRLFQDLVLAIGEQGYCVRPYKYCDMPYEPVSGLSFDDYLKDRPRDVRTEPRRRLRKLEKSHEIVFRIATELEEIDQVVKTFEQVNGASWREPEPFPDFDGGMLRAASADGVLRFGMMDIDGETAAVQIWLVSGGIATMFKIAFDEKFKKLHVGTLLMRHMIANVIEQEKVKEIDFGLYAIGYKMRWLSQLHEIKGIAAFNPKTSTGLTALIQYDGREALGKLWRLYKKAAKSAQASLTGAKSGKT
jgi:hypothetical protein